MFFISFCSFLLGKHKAAIEVYTEAGRLNQKDWVRETYHVCSALWPYPPLNLVDFTSYVYITIQSVFHLRPTSKTNRLSHVLRMEKDIDIW